MSNPCDIFDPGENPFPPAFPVDPLINTLSNHGVDIYAIPLYSAHMPNLKAGMVLSLLKNAKAAGKLNRVHTLVEASSGNSGLDLVLAAPHFGISKVVIVTDRDLAPRKREQLEFAGVSEIKYPENSETTIQAARRLGLQSGWLNLNQYANPYNWRFHYEHSGPHVWAQTKGKLSVFCAALGTTGTIVGVSEFLRSNGSRATIVGAACAPGNPVPGARTLEQLKEIVFDWQGARDEVMEVDRYTAYRSSLQLNRLGGMFGPSSGLAWAALTEFISNKLAAGKLDELRNKEGRVVAAFVCGDTSIPYFDKYSTILDAKEFGPLRCDD